MFPSGPSVSGFTPSAIQQQWAAYAALSGQQSLAGGQSIPLDRIIPNIVDSNNMLLGTLAPGFVRQPPNTAHPLPCPSVPSAPGSYTPHPALGYTFHQPLDTTGGNRQYANPYALSPYAQPGSTSSHPLSLSHATTLPYPQSIPYLSSPLMPAICNGTLNPIGAVAAQGIPTAAPLHHHQTQAHQPQQSTHVQQQHAAFAAAAALAAVNNPVRPYDSLKHFGALPQSQNRRSKPMITSKTNLYISGLSESDTDDTVRSLVEKIVHPKSCKAMVINGKCKGSGFIDCASEEDAEKAKNHILDVARRTGRKLSVKYAFENEKDALNVYVRHLPRSGFTKEMLQTMFQEFGDVTSVKLMETEAGLTGIGFVRFSTAEQAERAVEQMNEAKRVLMDNDKPVTCKLADKADPRRRTSTAAAAAAAVAVAAAAMMQHPRHQHTTSQLLGGGGGGAGAMPHSQNPMTHLPMAAVLPPSRGLVPTGALLSTSLNGTALTNAGASAAITNSSSSGTPAVLPTPFASSQPVQLTAGHQPLRQPAANNGGHNVSLPPLIGPPPPSRHQTPLLVYSPTLPAAGVLPCGPVSTMYDPVAASPPPRQTPSLSENSADVAVLLPTAADAAASAVELTDLNLAGSLSTAYAMNGVTSGDTFSSCTNSAVFCQPVVVAHEEDSADVDAEVQQAIHSSSPAITSTNTSPATASIRPQMTYIVTSGSPTAAIDSPVPASSVEHLVYHQLQIAESVGSTVSSTAVDAHLIDAITAGFQDMSASGRWVPDPSESESSCTIKAAEFDTTTRTTDSSHKTVPASQSVDPSCYTAQKSDEATYRGDTNSSSPQHIVGNRAPDPDDNRVSQNPPHTANDVYLGSMEASGPKRSVLTHHHPTAAASRQPALPGKRHQDVGAASATSSHNIRGHRRRSNGATGDSANNGRSKRYPLHIAAGARGFCTSPSSSPPVGTTNNAVNAAVNRGGDVCLGDDCLPTTVVPHDSGGVE